MDSNEGKREYCINKEFYNLAELKEIFEKDFTDYISDKKYREKIAEIFEVLRINTKYLKDNKGSGEYRIPKTSVKFLFELYDFYTKPEGQELRKGNINKVAIPKLTWIIEGFKKMLSALDLSPIIIDDQILSLKQRLGIEELQVKEEIKTLLNDIMLDIFPIEEDDPGDVRKLIYDEDKHFSYGRGLLSWSEMSYFYQMVKEDLKELRFKHHKIYGYMEDIRSEELNESIEKSYANMTEEEFLGLDAIQLEKYNIDKWLLESDEYSDLIDEEIKVRYSNDFIVDKERKLRRIQRELDRIEQKIVIEHLGEDAYYRTIRDGFDREDDDGWEKPSEIVFIEAVDEYEKNDSLDSFAEKIRKMSKT